MGEGIFKLRLEKMACQANVEKMLFQSTVKKKKFVHDFNYHDNNG